MIERKDLIILPGKLEAHILEGSYTLMSRENFDKALNSINRSILAAVAKGYGRFTQLEAVTKVPRGQLARHLRTLVKSGWLSKASDGAYAFASTVYIVYEVKESNNGLTLELSLDSGAFVDPQHGLVIVRGPVKGSYCDGCPLRRLCTANVKGLAFKYSIELHSVEPAEAYLEIFRTLILRDLTRALRKGNLTVRGILGFGQANKAKHPTQH